MGFKIAEIVRHMAENLVDVVEEDPVAHLLAWAEKGDTWGGYSRAEMVLVRHLLRSIPADARAEIAALTLRGWGRRTVAKIARIIRPVVLASHYAREVDRALRRVSRARKGLRDAQRDLTHSLDLARRAKGGG